MVCFWEILKTVLGGLVVILVRVVSLTGFPILCTVAVADVDFVATTALALFVVVRSFRRLGGRFACSVWERRCWRVLAHLLDRSLFALL